MDVTKPYEFIRFGAMDATKPYKFIGFGSFLVHLCQVSLVCWCWVFGAQALTAPDGQKAGGPTKNTKHSPGTWAIGGSFAWLYFGR